MKVKRFKTINSFEGSVKEDYEIPFCSEFGESLTDKSHFVPVSEAVRTLESSMDRAHIEDGNYDFSDGVDDGRSIPSSRNPHNREITQQFQEVQELTESARNAFNKGVKKAQIKQEINNLNSSSDSSPVTDGGN